VIPKERLNRYLAECPLVAIIRGVTPKDVEAIGRALFEAGIRIIEVPLNSPEPMESIRILAAALDGQALVGAGTVLTIEDVHRVQRAGGELVVSPNTNVEVISATVAAGMASCPGYFTPSEAFAALEAGADALKLFPAEGASPAVVKAQRAVLPKDVPLLVVGGIAADNMNPWRDAGASGFGLGSGLYKPGQSAQDTLIKAKTYVEGVNG
jgi:2-dehydro-3-deoxyphosphogalactonate aldolase